MKINELIRDAHKNATNKGFHDLENSILTKVTVNEIFTLDEVNAVRNAFKSQQLILIIGEISEAMEALRKNDIENFDEEIADVAIRLGDFSGDYCIDLEAEIKKKMEKNKLRPYKHGKQF